ncbi:PQQ-binding-like beta-propeller repeat protein [Streptomyces anulatus]|uniref:outer membrane protein assembly factor BamB family protein n=1 Tax=Streptomyces anulatus TaxID=1892 RepID=UPI003868F2F1
MNPYHYAKRRAKELTRQNGKSYAVNLAQVLHDMTSTAQKAVPAVGPYSTGGGGTVLEHRFGAVLLSHLLTRRPVPALGDHITPTHVRFQGREISRVDDLLVRGCSAAGAEHLLSVGVRRQPRLVPSEADSVQLVRAYLDVVIGHWPLLQSGRQRLALAVAPACQPVQQLAAVAVVAAAAPNPAEFRRRMAEGGYANKAMRGRLVQLDALVAAALGEGWTGQTESPTEVLTWRLLSKLSLIELRLEGADLSDRTEAVARLQRLTPRELPSEADALFAHLAELVGIYAPGGAEVDLPSLTADLHGLACFAPPRKPENTAETRTASGVLQQTRLPRIREQADASSRQQAVLWSTPALSGKALQPVLAGKTLVLRDGFWLLGVDMSTGKRLWPLQTAFDAPPVVGAGQVFVADRSGRAVPVDVRTGKKGQPLPARMLDGAAAVDRGTLFTVTSDAHVHAVDLASRVLLWTQPVSGTPVGPPRVDAGRVFVQTGDGGNTHGITADSLWVFGTDGHLQWMQEVKEGRLLHWTINIDHVYVVTRHQPGMSRVTALSVSNGQVCWQHTFDGDLTGRPTLARNCLYLTTAKADVITLSAETGQERWRVRTGVRTAAAAHISDGVVYLGLWQPRCLQALDADTGARLWQKKTSGSFASMPFTTAGIVYGGHRGGVLHGWNVCSRREVWHVEVMWDEARKGSPLLLDDRAYVTSSRGEVHALALHS